MDFMKHWCFSVAVSIGEIALAAAAMSSVNVSAQRTAHSNGPVIVADSSMLSQKLARDIAGNGARIVPLALAGRDSHQSILNAYPGRSSSAQGNTGVTPSLRYSPVTAQRYFITDLGTLGGTESFAYALNDHGQVVGMSRIAGDTSTHAFLYTERKMIDLYPFNSQEIQTVGPTSINNAGQIASGTIINGVYVPAVLDSLTGRLITIGSLGGITDFNFNGVATSINSQGNATGYSYLDSLNRHGFLYMNASFSDIGSFGGYSAGLAINDENQIAGFASDSNTGSAHAFLYTEAGMTQLDTSPEGYARDINDEGQIVGQFFLPPSGDHAFLYSQGNFTDLGLAGSPETVAYAISNRGQIVGISIIAGSQRAVILGSAGILDLNRLIPANIGWELTAAFDINSHGQIVGYGLFRDKFRAYLLTPAIASTQCKNEGWVSFGFRNQGQCIQYVNTGK